MDEERFGICERLGVDDALLESVTIKAKPEDFCVNEIDLLGRILEHSDEHFFDPSFAPPPVKVSSQDAVPTLEELVEAGIPENVGESVLQLHADPFSTLQVIIPNVASKEDRKALHAFFKAHFGGRLVTDCPPGTSDIRVSRRGHNSNRDEGRRYDIRNDKQADTFPYVQFVVCKLGLDTIDVVNYLSKQLRIAPKDISFAGTKDRQAVTVQRMAIRNIAVSKLVGIRGRNPRIKLSHIQPATQQINLGALSGNRFTLVLRDCKGFMDNRQIVANLSAGFINYYGKQRFGTQRVATHEIGAALLRGDFEGAVRMLLEAKPEDNPILRAKKETLFATWTKENIQGLLHVLPRQQSVEAALLGALSRNERDFQNAWMAVKRESRLLYVHAVQSWLWNHLVSHRVRLGLDTLKGDLIMVDNHPHVASDVGVGLKDVVVPLLGEDVVLPEYEGFAETLNELLMKLNLPIDFYNRNKNKALWDLGGDYRRVIVAVKNVQAECIDESTARVSFELPKSAYATMALRQVTRKVVE